MRTATIIDGAARRPVVVDPERGALPVDVVLPESSPETRWALEDVAASSG